MKPADLLGLAARLSTPALPVQVSTHSDGEGGSNVYITVDGLARDGVSFRRQPLRMEPSPRAPMADDAPLKLFDHRQPPGVDVGDPRFDAEFVALGVAARVLARLDAPTRAAALALVTGSVRVARVGLAEGSLEVEVPASGFARGHPGLETAGRAAVALARLLAPPLDVDARLVENLRRDPEPGVRLQSLLALVGHLPEGSARREALRQAARDPAPAIRLHAALALGDEGHALLVALADDTAAPDDCSAHAVRALGAAYPAARAEATLAHGLTRPGRHETTAACISALVSQGPAAVGALGRALVAAPADLAETLAIAVAGCGPALAEAPLLAALATGDAARERAATRALARVGTAASVLPLREAAARRLAGPLRGLVHEAVAAIQSRIAGAPGTLSLADPRPAGQLSLSDPPDGRVALTGDAPPAPPSGKR